MNKIIQGDCLEKLKELEENSVDSICTDPPYELGFMGKSWDNTGIANNPLMWAECLRVLKPGGHLLSFGGTRTYHRMAVAIEDAGFEVRDMVEWVYGSGFPKSLNIGKAVDKLNGKPRPTDEFKQFLRDGKKKVGLTSEQIDNEIGNGSGIFSQHYVGNNDQIEYPTKEKYQILKRILQLDNSFDYLINWAEAEREIIGKKEKQMQGWNMDGTTKFVDRNITLPSTNEAKQWEGWGTALKPAHEPICMARKPLAESTVASNVLKYGTGGINIDGSRVETTEDQRRPSAGGENGLTGTSTFKIRERKVEDQEQHSGRFPANLIHDNSEEVRGCFPETKSGSKPGQKGKSILGSENGETRQEIENAYGDSGNASRFFKSIIYQAKASKSERNKGCEELEDVIEHGHYAQDEWSRQNMGNTPDAKREPTKNNHPTVKPIALMEYLIKMVTPKGGVVLDPFAGSGSTLVAAKQNGFQYVGIELTPEYIPIIEARLNSTQVLKEQTKLL